MNCNVVGFYFAFLSPLCGRAALALREITSFTTVPTAKKPSRVTPVYILVYRWR